MPITAGTTFDRYQIISPLGSGGMGEVYLAQDTRLGRKVALKLLPDKFTQDDERLRRFEQEAYTASALNHPNIITIYEIGQAQERHFIATEYIEGATLRRRMLAGKLSLSEILDLATQVVSALAAAHAAGIVHRDIKPENIMIRPDGYAKVVDFGLAKLTEEIIVAGPVETQTAENLPQTPTTAEVAFNDTDEASSPDDHFATIPPPAVNQTVPGVVMGTAQYMSPEQGRGLRVDSRTDIFSVGIVLYEMIAARLPFRGATPKETVSAIIHSDPQPLVHFRPDTPEVLEWIVAKALVKDRDERYQTAREMLNDLKRLQHRLEIEQVASRSLSRNSGESGLPSAETSLNRDTTQDLELGSPSTGSRRPSSSLNFLPSHLSRSNYKNPLFISVVGISLAIIGVLLYLLLASRTQTSGPFSALQLRRFTSSGKATRAAISPDGKYVVHVLSDAGKQSLLVRQVTESNYVVIVPPADVIYRGLTFSRDGTHVYYIAQEQNHPKQKLFQVPVLGGTPRKILDDIDSPISLSPDNRQIAFVRRYRGQSKDALLIANVDGSQERELAVRQGPDFFLANGPAWSPDGRIIACPAGTNTGGRQMYVAEINVSDGKQKPLSAQRWSSVGRVAWFRINAGKSSGLIISATEQGSNLAQLWHLSYPTGIARRITHDLNDYRDLSLTDDARMVVTVQSEAHVNVWLLSNQETSRARRITDGVGQYNGVGGVTWLPDGKIVYISRASGSQDIWLMDQNGRDARPLTTAETRADRYPAVTPDGRYIVFVSTRTGNSNLYRLDVETGEQIALTSGTSEEFPVISADGQWVIYTATGVTKFTLWKVPINGGTPVQLTDRLSTWPAVSPDGKHIACWYRAESNARWQIAIIPIDGGDPEKTFDVPSTAETPIPLRWLPGGQAITFADTRDGASNIWSQPLDGSPPRQITDFTSDQIFWFDWSHDGKQLACSRGTVTSDVVLLSDAKR